MEDNFRNALIIISGVVIAAIFIHGVWTIRKPKNPYKLKTSNNKVKSFTRYFDDKGFDQDGVGQAKVQKQTNEPDVSSKQDFEQPISLDEISHLDGGQNNEVYSELTSQEQVPEHSLESDLPASPKTPTKATNAREEKATNAKKEIVLEKPIYQQPVIQAKPATKQTQKGVNIKPTTKADLKRGALKQTRIEINFGDGLVLDDEPVVNINIDEPKVKVEQESKNKKTDNPVFEPQIIILSVVMPTHQQMSGAVLLPSLLTLGMKYGEMNIFHRHQDNAGNGAVTFSLANILNPGSFDLDTMETFVTQGVSLFMILPNATDPFIAFEQMLVAAKQLASEFNAQLVDDKRNVMTKQTEQHYVSKIREFDRQHRLTSVE